jgi:hypothetical protein
VKPVSAKRIWCARLIALGADFIQVGLPFLFGEGFISPFDNALDVVVCLLLTLLVGWHIAFLPSFLIEFLPFANLAPTWTLAAFIATRNRLPPKLPPPDSRPPAPSLTH